MSKPRSSTKPLKPTPASSPLLRAPLDEHGEPTHPELVREQGTHEPGDDDHFDPVQLGPCLCKRGVGVVYAFWFQFDDGEERGVYVRSYSYSAGAKAARAWFEQHTRAKIVKLRLVEISDGLSEKRDAMAALQPRTHWMR